MADGEIMVKCPNCGGSGCTLCVDGKYTVSTMVVTDIMADLDKCKKRLKKIMDKLGVDD